MKRKGMGKGKGIGYKNMIKTDPLVHSRSAKGQKSVVNPVERRMSMESKKHNLTIEPTFVPTGAGNNPDAGKRDLHYKIKEWGFVFPSKQDAEKYANEHIEKNGVIVKKKSVKPKSMRATVNDAYEKTILDSISTDDYGLKEEPTTPKGKLQF